MKSSQISKLDASTPRWPVIQVNLAEPPTVTVSGITTELDTTDPQLDAVRRASRQARDAGHPVRMIVSTATRNDQRLIVTPSGVVVPLDSPRTTAPAAKTSRPAKAAPRKAAGVVSRFPRPVRWAGLGLAVLTAVALVVIVFHGRTPAQAAPETVSAPLPPAGHLYTELPPPGWSQDAAWVLPIAPKTRPVTDPSTGVTAVVTAADRSTSETAGQKVERGDLWLSILERDGRTRHAATLDDLPRFGPVITHIDRAAVVLVGTTDQIRYWQLDGGAETDIDLPAGAQLSAAGESLLLTLPGDRLGYLHNGGLQTVQLLPRTDPAIALDGAVIVTQPDTGAWWTLRADAAPTSLRPVAPDGAGAVDKVIAVTTNHVLVTWHPTPVPKLASTIIGAYDRTTGQLLASTAAPAISLGVASGKAIGDATITAVGAVLFTALPPAVTVVPGLSVTAVRDKVYGTIAGKPVAVGADGKPVLLPDGTLVPTGVGSEQAMVVSADGKLYALNPAAA